MEDESGKIESEAQSEPGKPRQNKALQNGGGTALGIGGLTGGTLAILLQGVLEKTGMDFSTEWYTALGMMIMGLAQLAATKLTSDS
jgi:hypothetical protein